MALVVGTAFSVLAPLAPAAAGAATAVPALTTSSAAAGPSIIDTATLAGGSNPTGGISFTIFGPNDPTCTRPPVSTSTTSVFGDGQYPSGPFFPTAPGTYNFVASYSGDAGNLAVSSPCGAPGESVSFTGPPLSLFTTASVTGATISDQAILFGGFSPTGTITFNAFGPNDPTCTGPPAFTSTIPVPGPGSSGPFTTTATGSYTFVATYSGDANNPSMTSSCGAPLETVVVVPVMPIAIATAASAFGATIMDSATLSGGSSPTGTITFTAFGPNNPTCSGPPLATSTGPEFGGFSFSGPVTVPSPGSYSFVASYSGDANNPPVTSPCGAPGETVVLDSTGPLAITTNASTLPGAIMDSATLSGGFNPTGTVTFTAFGPNNPTCSGLPPFTATVSLIGPAFAISPPFAPSIPGMYNFVAVYSGDANNPSVTSPCGAPGETVTVSPPPQIAVSKAASPLSLPAPGGTFTFTVQVTNPGASDPVTIRTLIDDVYGFLPARAGSTCGALVGVTLAPRTSSAPCSFTGQFTGTAGQSQTDMVTVFATDQSGVPTTASATATVTIAGGRLAPSTTVVGCSPVSVRVGRATTCTATVTGAEQPTGTVRFASNSSGTFASSPCSLHPIGGNQARCSVTYTPGAVETAAHKMYASYSGDAGNGSSHASTTVVVRPAPGATSVACSPASIRVGGVAACTATVTGATHPAGLVAFHTNSSATFSSPLCLLHAIGGNQARCSVTYTARAVGSGAHKIYANYSGDPQNEPSASSATLTVTA